MWAGLPNTSVVTTGGQFETSCSTEECMGSAGCQEAPTQAMKTTVRPLNFFSSSRISRVCTFWNCLCSLTGIWMTMAFFPPTSISCRQANRQHRPRHS